MAWKNVASFFTKTWGRDSLGWEIPVSARAVLVRARAVWKRPGTQFALDRFHGFENSRGAKSGKSDTRRRMSPKSGPKRLRELLKQPGIIRSLGAHDVFTALIVEQAGFETVFYSFRPYRRAPDERPSLHRSQILRDL